METTTSRTGGQVGCFSSSARHPRGVTRGWKTDVSSPGSQPSLSEGIDWVHVTFAFDELDTVQAKVVSLFEAVGLKDWSEAGHGFLGYSEVRDGPEGARVAWDPKRPGQKVLVALPGKACRVLGVERILAFLRWCGERDGAAVRRLDVFVDDHEERLGPDFLDQEWRRSAVSYARAAQLTKGSRRTGGEVIENGWTWRVGSRTSERMLRVYDKTTESGGETKAHRLELEFKGQKAEAAARMLAATSAEVLGSAIARLLVDLVDFREPESYNERNKERRRRCGWFRELLGDVTRAKLTPAKEPRGFAEVLDWVCDQLAPTLAIVAEGFGLDTGKARLWPEPFGRILRSGVDRLKPRHRRLLASSPIAGFQLGMEVPT